eukprot:COSAG06_NODE_570_length_14115_cov_11.866010_15_plen_93_part_00
MISLELARRRARKSFSRSAVPGASQARLPDDCVLLLEHTAGRARKLSSFGGTQALVAPTFKGTAKKSDGDAIEIYSCSSWGQSSVGVRDSTR